jgi:hypothetical protein
MERLVKISSKMISLKGHTVLFIIHIFIEKNTLYTIVSTGLYHRYRYSTTTLLYRRGYVFTPAQKHIGRGEKGCIAVSYRGLYRAGRKIIPPPPATDPHRKAFDTK